MLNATVIYGFTRNGLHVVIATQSPFRADKSQFRIKIYIKRCRPSCNKFQDNGSTMMHWYESETLAFQIGIAYDGFCVSPKIQRELSLPLVVNTAVSSEDENNWKRCYSALVFTGKIPVLLSTKTLSVQSVYGVATLHLNINYRSSTFFITAKAYLFLIKSVFSLHSNHRL